MWIRVGWRDEGVSPEEMFCEGCATVKSCRYDNIRICTKGKGITNCGECTDYPCREIVKVFERSESYERKCKGVCSHEEYGSLYNAFFLKKQTLDAIHYRRKQ